MTSPDGGDDIEALLDKLDGSGSDQEWSAVSKLRASLGDTLPSHLLRRFRTTRKWAARSSLVYHSVRYAAKSDSAIELALAATTDRSKVVRYRAFMLLACSQRKDLLPTVQKLEDVVPDDTKEDARAAADAIEAQNRNFFVDRDHSGQVTLNIRSGEWRRETGPR